MRTGEGYMRVKKYAKRKGGVDTTFFAVIATLTFTLLITVILFASWKDWQDESLAYYGAPIGRMGEMIGDARLINASMEGTAEAVLLEAFRDEWFRGPFTCPLRDGRYTYENASCADTQAFIQRVISRANKLIREENTTQYILLSPAYIPLTTPAEKEGSSNKIRVQFTGRILLSRDTGQRIKDTPLGMLLSIPFRFTINSPQLTEAASLLEQIRREGLRIPSTAQAYNESLLLIQLAAEMKGMLESLPTSSTQEEGTSCTLATITLPRTVQISLLQGGKREAIMLNLPAQKDAETVAWMQDPPITITMPSELSTEKQACPFKRLSQLSGIPLPKKEAGQTTTSQTASCVTGKKLSLILTTTPGKTDMGKEESAHTEASIQISMDLTSLPKRCGQKQDPLSVTTGDLHTTPGRIHIVTRILPDGIPRVILPNDVLPPVLVGWISSLITTITQSPPSIIRIHTDKDINQISLPERIREETIHDIRAFYQTYGLKTILILLPLTQTSGTGGGGDLSTLLAENLTNPPMISGQQGRLITIHTPLTQAGRKLSLPVLPRLLLTQEGGEQAFTEERLPLAFSLPASATWPVESVYQIRQCPGPMMSGVQPLLEKAYHDGLDILPLPETMTDGQGSNTRIPLPAGAVRALLPGRIIGFSMLIPRGSGSEDQYVRITYYATNFMNTLKEKGLISSSFDLPKDILPLGLGQSPLIPFHDGVLSLDTEPSLHYTEEGVSQRVWKGKLGEVLLIYHPDRELISIYAHLAPMSILTARQQMLLQEQLKQLDTPTPRETAPTKQGEEDEDTITAKDLFTTLCRLSSYARFFAPGNPAYCTALERIGLGDLPLTVNQGSVIGQVGMTGDTQEPVLHLTILDARSLKNEGRSAAVRNPLCILPQYAPQCTSPECDRKDAIDRVSLYPLTDIVQTLIERGGTGERIPALLENKGSLCLIDEAGAAGLPSIAPPCPKA